MLYISITLLKKKKRKLRPIHLNVSSPFLPPPSLRTYSEEGQALSSATSSVPPLLGGRWGESQTTCWACHCRPLLGVSSLLLWLPLAGITCGCYQIIGFLNGCAREFFRRPLRGQPHCTSHYCGRTAVSWLHTLPPSLAPLCSSDSGVTSTTGLAWVSAQ